MVSNMNLDMKSDGIESEENNTESEFKHEDDAITTEDLLLETKTEMLYIIEDDLKLKLEIQDIKKQFLLLLQDFRNFDSGFDDEDDHDTMFYTPDIPSSPEIKNLNQLEDLQNCEGQRCEEVKDTPQSAAEISDSLPDSNDSSFLSDIHVLPDASIEDQCIQKYFGGSALKGQCHKQGADSRGRACLNGESSSLPTSNRSSYGDLTAPNQTAASESTSNWDNVYINNLSKQEEVEEDSFQTKGAKPKRLKVYIQNIPWDNSSDSSYNKPYPDYKPELHPELKKSIAQHNFKSVSSMDSSLANLSDITKCSEMSSRFVHSQTDASDYNSCSPEDLPHQSTPTGSSASKKQEQARIGSAYQRRGSPTGCATDSDNNNHLVTPVGRIPGSEICSSMDDSTPIVIPRTRRHLFHGEDSGITGSASDYTSSPSTMRENINNNNTPGVLKMDREMFLLMDENRTFNCKGSSSSSQPTASLQPCTNNDIDLSLEVTRDSEANMAEVTGQPDDYLTRSNNATSSSSNLSPLTSCTASSYKESDGKSSPYPDSIDMALRTTIDGEEGYHQVITNLKTTSSAKPDSGPPKSTSSRPPCIGKEATPENKLQGGAYSIVGSMTSPPQRNLTAALTQAGSDSSSGDLPASKPPLPGYEELKKKATSAPPRPVFTSYDGSEAVLATVGEDTTETNAKEVLNVDQYSKSPKDGYKKKTFFKKLKGIRKHFRSNSRSKAYVKNE